MLRRYNGKMSCAVPLPLGFSISVHYKGLSVHFSCICTFQRSCTRFSMSLLAEAAEEGDVVAEHGVVGAGVLHGGVELVLNAGDGLEKELA